MVQKFQQQKRVYIPKRVCSPKGILHWIRQWYVNIFKRDFAFDGVFLFYVNSLAGDSAIFITVFVWQIDSAS